MLSVKALLLILAPLLDAMRGVAAMRQRLDLAALRAAIGVAVYFAMLDLVTIAAYALWAGPERFGISESWALALYFVVPYLGTLLVAAGIVAVLRAGPGLVRRML